MNNHILKTDPEVFEAVRTGAKTFEIRFNDRDFKVGDELYLRETVSTGAEMRDGAPLVYTGRLQHRTVSHVLTGYGLMDGWCCLSLKADESHPQQFERADAGRVAPASEGIQLAVKLLAQIGDDESDAAIEAVQHAADQAQRVADLEAERDELLARLADSEANVAEVSNAYRAARDERDALRANLDGIEAQEPVPGVVLSEYGPALVRIGKETAHAARRVYARPVPAIPAGWKMVPVEPTQKQWNAGCKAAREYLDEAGGNSPAVIYRAMVDEAPEHKS